MVQIECRMGRNEPPQCATGSDVGLRSRARDTTETQLTRGQDPARLGHPSTREPREGKVDHLLLALPVTGSEGLDEASVPFLGAFGAASDEAMVGSQTGVCSCFSI